MWTDDHDERVTTRVDLHLLFFVNVLGALRLLRLAKVRLPVLRSAAQHLKLLPVLLACPVAKLTTTA